MTLRHAVNDKRATVQGPVKKPPMDYMSRGGGGGQSATGFVGHQPVGPCPSTSEPALVGSGVQPGGIACHRTVGAVGLAALSIGVSRRRGPARHPNPPLPVFFSRLVVGGSSMHHPPLTSGLSGDREHIHLSQVSV